MLQTLRKKFIGDRTFYKMVLTLAVPIIIQNVITTFVSLLDNIMVGQIGTEQMSGVAIANQLMFVYNLSVMGGFAGAGIFTAQFHGKRDDEGIRYTMRFKALVGALITLATVLLFWLADEQLISLFLHEGSASGDLQLTLRAGCEYLHIMLPGMLAFAAAQVYVGTLSEVGETSLPMKAGVAAVLVNLFFNWVLIYGHFGAPAMGVRGAAIATVLSRYVELAIAAIWTHRHSQRFAFIVGVWHSLRLPMNLFWDIVRRGMPLMANEVIWSFSMTAINQSYSVRGLAVVAAINIATTIVNLFNCFYASLGASLGIMVGRLLGQGKTREAVDTDRKLIFFSVSVTAVIGCCMALLAGLFPRMYNTTGEVRTLAAYFIGVSGLLMPMFAFLHGSYFTLRCGGKTGVTFLFDCMFICCVSMPLAYVLAHFTGVDIRLLYLAVQLVDFVKCIIGYVLVKKRIWVHNIVGGALEDC